MRVVSKLVRAAWLIWAVFLPSPSAGQARQPASPKRVLILYWYNKDYSGNTDFDRLFQTALRSAAPGGIEFYSEYLESNRFPEESQSAALHDYLRQKYARHAIDVVVSNTKIALDFLLKYRNDLFPGTPLVFASSEPPAAKYLTSGPGATGIIYLSSYRKTIDMALKLHPDTEHLFVVSGTLTHDEYYQTIARNQLQRYENTVAITYLTDLPPGQLLARLQNLPERSIVLYLWQQVLNDRGKLMETKDVLTLIAPLARAPIYGMSFSDVGLGVVGGYVWTLETEVAKLAEITLRVANGVRAGDIPVENAPDLPIFDWRQLQRWSIHEDRLPPGSIIRFRELTMWQQYRWRIVSAIAVFLFQALLISALLVERHRARQGATALIKAQRVLQESEERFRNMADTAPAMIWVSGPDQLYTFFNKGWLTFTGREMEEELGKGWTERLHPDDLDRCSATYSSSFDLQSPFQMEYRLRRADGEYRSLLCTGVPRFQEDGVFAGYIGSCLDITDLKRSQERALAGQKLESMGLLASGIAHDFNNLLGGILTSAELALAEYAANEPHEEELLRIKAAAVGGAQIVRELMIFGGKQSSAFEPVDCSVLVREMSQVLKVSISKYATLKTELRDDLTMVNGNPAQIRQLIMNLVINASQAIGERKGEIRISVKMLTAEQSAPVVAAANLPHGGYLQLEVADSGDGMPEETKAKIFDPFFTTKAAGRGLGLAVVQGVVRAHGGVIRVVSAPGSGTTFQILLPCIATPTRESHASPAGRAEDAALTGFGTLLVIEDENTLRLTVSKMLRTKGFSVIEAEDGNTGVDQFQANAPRIDVVLLDMTLPGKSGPVVLRELQSIRPDVKVVVTSAYGQDQVRKSLDGLPYWAYVQKPYHLAELAKLLRDASAEMLASSHTAS